MKISTISKHRLNNKYLAKNSSIWKHTKQKKVNENSHIYYSFSKQKLSSNIAKWNYKKDAVSLLENNIPSDIRDKFNSLANRWEKETCYKSLMSDIVIHEAYQQIIGMGSAVVPLLLEDLTKSDPRHWFWALKAITGTSPIKPEHKGRIKKMAEDWLEWGKANGYEFRYSL